MLAHIDLAQIEENDPMKKGPEIDYQEDLVMTVKLKTFKRTNFDDDNDALSSNEVIHIKVLSTGEGDMGGNIYIELTSEDDLFFHYQCE